MRWKLRERAPVREEWAGTPLTDKEAYKLLHAIADKHGPQFQRTILSTLKNTIKETNLAMGLESLILNMVADKKKDLSDEELTKWAIGYLQKFEQSYLTKKAPQKVGKAVQALFADVVAIKGALLPDGAKLDFDLTNKTSVDFIKTQTKKVLAVALGKDVLANGTIKYTGEAAVEKAKELAKVIQKGFEEGIPPKKLAKIIEPLIGLNWVQMKKAGNLFDKAVNFQGSMQDFFDYTEKARKYRALMIARTETIRAANSGQQILWKKGIEQGLLPKTGILQEWIATEDDRICPVCRDLDGKTAPVVLPGKHKGKWVTITGSEVTGPPAHPNCRCAVALVIDDDAVQAGPSAAEKKAKKDEEKKKKAEKEAELKKKLEDDLKAYEARRKALAAKKAAERRAKQKALKAKLARGKIKSNLNSLLKSATHDVVYVHSEAYSFRNKAFYLVDLDLDEIAKLEKLYTQTKKKRDEVRESLDEVSKLLLKAQLEFPNYDWAKYTQELYAAEVDLSKATKWIYEGRKLLDDLQKKAADLKKAAADAAKRTAAVVKKKKAVVKKAGAKKVAKDQQRELKEIKEAFEHPLSEDELRFKKYGDAKGSNPGGFFEGSDGVKRYIKDYPDDAQAVVEVLTNRIYRDMGIPAPRSHIFIRKDGGISVASEIIDGASKYVNTEKAAKEILDGFALDVWTANWDVVGLTLDNVIDAGGTVWRIDNGGSMLFRANQGRKQVDIWENGISEWDVFPSSKNPSYQQIFQKAGVSGPEELKERIVAQIRGIEQTFGKAGGGLSDEFVAALRAIPGRMKPADRASIEKGLAKRLTLLAEKRALIEEYVKTGKMPGPPMPQGLRADEAFDWLINKSKNPEYARKGKRAKEFIRALTGSSSTQIRTMKLTDDLTWAAENFHDKDPFTTIGVNQIKQRRDRYEQGWEAAREVLWGDEFKGLFARYQGTHFRGLSFYDQQQLSHYTKRPVYRNHKSDLDKLVAEMQAMQRRGEAFTWEGVSSTSEHFGVSEGFARHGEHSLVFRMLDSFSTVDIRKVSAVGGGEAEIWVMDNQQWYEIVEVEPNHTGRWQVSRYGRSLPTVLITLREIPKPKNAKLRKFPKFLEKGIPKP